MNNRKLIWESLFLLSLLFPVAACSITAFSVAAHGEEITVRPVGNPVASGLRLKSVLENLKAGDTVIIDDGSYQLPGGVKLGGVKPNGQFKRIDGWNNRITTIVAKNRRQAHLLGNLEVQGSFIRIEGLRIQGAEPPNDRPGIEISDSHNIEIIDNEVFDCGGGGINFNHSDIILISQNLTHGNGTRNKDQHSGISVYQPINLGVNPNQRFWGVKITRNISHRNRNEKTTREGNLTDGNGIVVDDYKYTQSTWLSDYNKEKIGTDPSIKWKNKRIPYSRPTLIEGNLCYFNGGSGIQCYLAVGVKVKNNTCVGNRNMTRWEGRYLNLGQISLQDSVNCEVCNNIMQSRRVKMSPTGTSFAATEKNQAENSGNHKWYNNLLHCTQTDDQKQLIDNLNIGEGAIFADPQFDESNESFRPQAGHGQGITWGGEHVYVDLYGTEVKGDAQTDLGAIQASSVKNTRNKQDSN